VSLNVVYNAATQIQVPVDLNLVSYVISVNETCSSYMVLHYFFYYSSVNHTLFVQSKLLLG
jgi:hypothetical protein